MSIISNFDLEEIAEVLKIPLISVCNKDLLRDIKNKKNGFYVVNLQNSVDANGNQLEGTHWVCFGKFKNQTAFYFDSYGFKPPLEILHFLRHCKTLYNKTQIQSLGQVCCGWYCIGIINYFVTHPSNSIEQNINGYSNLFSKTNLTGNQKILEKYLKKQININTSSKY